MTSAFVVHRPSISRGRRGTVLPVTVCSATELENLVTLRDASASQLLLERHGDPLTSTYSFNTVLVGRNCGRNAILDAGWDSYPWKRHADLESEAAVDQ
ncbi:hypothetical protein AB0P40_29600 [Streptomyces sp. NPDC079189]|uniref:hypothetical protein n=1 Tax=Streptomyces sp. NPDC079189 TaxID=3154514 RepID=UPI003418003E